MLCVESEIAPLRRVIIHRPGIALQRITPETFSEFLFDDILYTEEADKEHDIFAEILRSRGATVYYLDHLLKDILQETEVRKWILTKLLSKFDLNLNFIKYTYDYLYHLSTDRLCYHLIAGITLGEAKIKRRGIIGRIYKDSDFIIPPLPNHYFTRDPSCWIGKGVAINRMEFEVRRGETLNTAAIYKFHPMFKEESFGTWYNGTEGDRLSMEGGDVLVIHKDCVMIGLGQRTHPQSIEILAHRLFANNVVKQILLVELPKSRACMHLDTVMTMVDETSFCVAFSDFSPRVWSIYPEDQEGDLVLIEEESLLNALKKVLKTNSVRFISVGNGEDTIVQRREQWTDASNLLAVAPGVVVGYGKNERTNKVLREAGIEILEIPGAELGRGRGGARCMSCPIERATTT